MKVPASAPLMTPEDIAIDLGRSVRWVREELIGKRRIGHVRVGRLIRVSVVEYRQWIADHTVSAMPADAKRIPVQVMHGNNNKQKEAKK